MRKRDRDRLADRASRLKCGTFLPSHCPPGKKNRPDTGSSAAKVAL